MAKATKSMKDKAMDRKKGIREGGKRDRALDRKKGLKD